MSEAEQTRFLQQFEQWFDCTGARMRYLHLSAREPLAPPRPPLVLIHGLMGYSFSWRFNLEELSLHRDVYAVDLLGIGCSDRPVPGDADYGMAAAASRVLALIRRIGAAPVDILGTSHGGAVAMMAASLEPARIRRLALVAPAHPFMINSRLRIAFFRSAVGRFLARRLLMHNALMLNLSIGRLYADSSKVTAETRRGYDLNLRDATSYEYALEILRTWYEDMHRLRDALPAIAHIPALLLWGEADQAVACHSALMLREFFRSAELVVLPGIGHMTYEEDPPLFNRTVLRFLDS
ncbi:MAG: alpha/beta hydrolase [Acidobacteriota bacterium]|nr:alpha/beta hydrolase [Acidobacteriota bacterium]